MTTFTFLGVMIMVHADNQGLVLPPRVACIQVSSLRSFYQPRILQTMQQMKVTPIC